MKEKKQKMRRLILLICILLLGGQLRFYFKDIEGVNITATPIGYYTNTEGLADTVQEAYTSNLDDTWGVSVYFWITKTLK